MTIPSFLVAQARNLGVILDTFLSVNSHMIHREVMFGSISKFVPNLITNSTLVEATSISLPCYHSSLLIGLLVSIHASYSLFSTQQPE